MQKSNHAAESIEIAVPISEKYTLTIKEATLYFNIGVKKNAQACRRKSGKICNLQWKPLSHNPHKV